MKTVTKLVMGAVVLAASAGAAHAANTTLPSTDNSNLLFFVNDATSHSTYEVVLSQLINGSTGYFNSADATSSTTQGVVNSIFGDSNFTLSLGSDTALQTFITNADNAGDTLQWGIQNAAYTGSTPTIRETQGNVLTVATVATSGNPLTVGESAIAGAIPADFNTDAGHLNSKTLDSFMGTTGGIFGTSASAGGVNINLYGNGTVVGSAIGSSAGLYGFTANGSGTAGDAIAFSLGSVSFDGSTLTFTGNTASAPVPLPAAAWLFGSGLLGLFGVGRRRDRASTAA